MSDIRRATIRRLKRTVRETATALGWHGRPGFLIIGAQKAGTSALYAYLSRHPGLVPAIEKETYFFSPEALYGWTEHPHYRFFVRLQREGFEPFIKPWALRWYHAQFSVPRPGRWGLNFEGSPGYLYFPFAARQIRSYRPDMKLIALLRDPVERAYSAWNMFRQLDQPPYAQLREQRGFEEAVHDEIAMMGRNPLMVGTDYVRRGVYHDQLRRFLDHFPREQLLILEDRQLRTETWPTLQKVCDFLEVERFKREGEELSPVLVGRYHDEMPAAARALLARFYAPHNQALFDLLGRTYDWSK